MEAEPTYSGPSYAAPTDATTTESDRASLRLAGDPNRTLRAQAIRLSVTRFMSFGRLPHLRRSILNLPGVVSARIVGYADWVAEFELSVHDGTTASHLVLHGTELVDADYDKVILRVL